MKKTILVTGGSGYQGVKLIERLIKDNYNVINIDKNLFGNYFIKSKKVRNFKLDINQIRKRLANYFGGNGSNYEWVKSFDIKNATIKQENNFFDSNTFSPLKGFIVAGDHSVYGSIEGAVLSGINASKKILN